MRLRDLAGRDRVELAALAGVAATAVGVAVVADALVSAAQSHPGAGAMGWSDRLLLGLWAFRIEHGLWFTLAAIAFAWAIARGARLGGWGGPLARLVGGFAVGLVLVAAAMMIASTYVALVGHLGPDADPVRFSGRERFFTWLLQLVTGAGAAVVWGLLAGRLSVLAERALELPEPAAPGQEEGPFAHAPAFAAEPEAAVAPLPLQPAAARAAAAAASPAPPASPVPPPAAPVVDTLAARAERLYRDQLAWSPQRPAARRLVDEIASLERSGRLDEAGERWQALARLGGPGAPDA